MVEAMTFFFSRNNDNLDKYTPKKGLFQRLGMGNFLNQNILLFIFDFGQMYRSVSDPNGQNL